MMKNIYFIFLILVVVVSRCSFESNVRLNLVNESAYSIEKVEIVTNDEIVISSFYVNEKTPIAFSLDYEGTYRIIVMTSGGIVFEQEGGYMVNRLKVIDKFVLLNEGLTYQRVSTDVNSYLNSMKFKLY
ncbi:hypothetical protein LP316_13285 [Thalassotalea sp. LPB0316]|uniref:hypothetical protein n=1 Tax=Thalassotalea sp. LPB0316 TaxID=2769490 RepID=UPI001867C96B|nr:hypothetical protein [Thalassotalea sp. LPB0316]QOL25257.1 hypothetical protein LP316_13285 [Thalassotalea sp. LPB0316]